MKFVVATELCKSAQGFHWLIILCQRKKDQRAIDHLHSICQEGCAGYVELVNVRYSHSVVLLCDEQRTNIDTLVATILNDLFETLLVGLGIEDVCR